MKWGQDNVLFEVRIPRRVLWRVAVIGLLLALAGLVGRITPAQASMQAVMDPVAFASLVPLVEPPGSPLPLPLPNLQVQLAGLDDFDEDGQADLLVMANHVFQVYLGDGKGGFTPLPLSLLEEIPPEEDGTVIISSNSPLFFRLLGHAVGDFNGDGHLDVVLLDEARDLQADTVELRLYVLLGDGEGRFAGDTTGPVVVVRPALTLPELTNPENSPFALAAEDFNQDGALDLLAFPLFVEQPVAQVLTGAGDGTFAGPEPLDLSLPGPITRVFFGDFNQDGARDAALQRTDGVVILKGQTDAGFQPRTAFTLDEGQTLTDVVLSDVDGDTVPDAVALIDGDTLAVYVQQSGRFVSASRAEPGVRAERLVSGDFNADGLADLALVVRDRQELQLFIGDGQGRFTLPLLYHTLIVPNELIVQDLNADGRADFVLSGGFSLQVLVHQEKPQGTGRVNLGSNVILTTTDLAGDGDQDVVTAGLNGVEALWNNGRGVFAPRRFAPIKAQLWLRGAAGDFNGDGQNEVLVLGMEDQTDPDSGFLSVLGVSDELGLGQVQNTYSLNITGVPNLGVGDLDGDGNLDAVTTTESALTLWRGDGQGNLSPQAFSVQGTLTVAAVGDFDGNGRSEVLAVITGQQAQLVQLNIVNGALNVSAPLAVSETAPLVLTRSDLNVDGLADAVLMSIKVSATQGVTDAILSLVRGQAKGTPSVTEFSIPNWQADSTPLPFWGLAAGDFTGDGLVDVGVAVTIRQVFLRLLKGENKPGDFAEVPPPVCTGGPLFAADLDGNGPQEFVASSESMGGFNPYACILWNGGGQ